MSEQVVRGKSADNDSASRSGSTSCEDQALVILALIGNIEALLQKLQSGGNINARGVNGQSLVGLAAMGNHAACVKALVNFGADVDAPDCCDCTPLYRAADLGKAETVRVLLQCGADANRCWDIFAFARVVCGTDFNFGRDSTVRFFSPLYIAAKNGHAEAVKVLLDHGANPKFDVLGVIPLCSAASGGHVETVRVLARCADDQMLNAALYDAVSCGHAETVRALLECGADANASWNGPAFWCVKHKFGENASCDGLTPLFIAAILGHAETVWALVEGGADVNTGKLIGFSAVCIAGICGHAKTVRALAECGADMKNLNSALHFAAQRGETAAVWMLVREFAASDIPDGWLAKQKGFPKTATVLNFLQQLEGAAPVHALANAVRRADFECPVCIQPRTEANALVPCGHSVCESCWYQLGLRNDDERCPMCRKSVLCAAAHRTWPDQKPLYARFCVEMPKGRDII